MNRHGLVAATVVVVLGAPACGSDPAAGEPAGTTPITQASVPVPDTAAPGTFAIDACALVTAEQVEDRFGSVPEGGETEVGDPRVVGSCRWDVRVRDEPPIVVWTTVSTDTEMVGLVPPEEMVPIEAGDGGLLWQSNGTVRFIVDGQRVEIYTDAAPAGLMDDELAGVLVDWATTAGERVRADGNET